MDKLYILGKNSPFIKSSNLFSFFNSSQIKFLILSYTLGEAGAEGLSVLFICLTWMFTV